MPCINLYWFCINDETLSEPSDLFALASALVGNAPNDQYTVIELNVEWKFMAYDINVRLKSVLSY
jgi:hypothetical protein